MWSSRRDVGAVRYADPQVHNLAQFQRAARLTRLAVGCVQFVQALQDVRMPDAVALGADWGAATG